jgi:pyruvate/2-oxoglutarate dehydrogenase complex dihydrolipoamide acyltransferase (E2) component
MLAEIVLPTTVAIRGPDAGAVRHTGAPDVTGFMTDWLAFSGDYVQKGRLLGHAEIDGAPTDITAPATGVLQILAPVDRPVPGLGLVGVVDTAPDARSLTVTFTPTEPAPIQPSSSAPACAEWAVNLPAPAPWTAGPLAASGPATPPDEVAAAPPPGPDQSLPPAPDFSPPSWDRRTPGAGGQDSLQPPATRLRLLSRQIATPPAPREPAVTPFGEPSPTSAELAPAEAAARPGTPPASDEPARTPPPASEPSTAPVPALRARLYASPRARTLARQTGVDMISVQGSGPFGRVEEADVRQYLDANTGPGARITEPPGHEQASQVEGGSVIVIETTAFVIAEQIGSPAPTCSPTSPEGEQGESPGPVSPPPSESDPSEFLAPISEPLYMAAAPVEPVPAQAQPSPWSALRQIEADQPPSTWQPVASLTIQVDATNLILVRERLTGGIQKRTGEPLSYHVMLSKLVALALLHHPELNARQTDQGSQNVSRIDLGLVSDIQSGRATHVLADAGSKDLLTLSREAAMQAQGALPHGDIPATPRAASFDIVYLGNSSADVCTPALQSPQSAVLGIGRMAPRPAVHEGQVVVRTTVFLSLSYQSMGINAVQAASFLTRLVALVQDPAPLAEGLIY